MLRLNFQLEVLSLSVSLTLRLSEALEISLWLCWGIYSEIVGQRLPRSLFSKRPVDVFLAICFSACCVDFLVECLPLFQCRFWLYHCNQPCFWNPFHGLCPFSTYWTFCAFLCWQEHWNHFRKLLVSVHLAKFIYGSKSRHTTFWFSPALSNR